MHLTAAGVSRGGVVAGLSSPLFFFPQKNLIIMKRSGMNAKEVKCLEIRGGSLGPFSGTIRYSHGWKIMHLCL